MKLPETSPPVPRLRIESARWSAQCGRCLGSSCVVTASSERDAWNEIASREGWCVYEPGPGLEPYPICLSCAEAGLPAEAKRRA